MLAEKNQECFLAYDDETLRPQAERLAASLNLRIDNGADYRLLLTAEGLWLSVKGFSPLRADFTRQAWQKRHQAGKGQGLIQACQPKPGMTIIDATAGWGRDALLLASFGARVVMLERQPMMAALLADALLRKETVEPGLVDLHLQPFSAFDYLPKLLQEDYPEVIYLDPMHPARKKSALVKKDLQALQQLIGPDEDARALLDLARRYALKKVVLKWPAHQPALLKPDVVIKGKTVRFDIYLPYRSG